VKGDAKKGKAGQDREDEIRELVRRAHEGDAGVLPRLRRLLDERPEVWRQAGDLARHAEQCLLDVLAGKSLFAREAVGRKLAELKAGLAGPEPTPLERLLVERIALAWLQVHHLDLEVAALPGGQAAGPPGVYAQRRLDSAQRRYLQSIKALATIRKLLTPRLAPLEVSRRLGAGASGEPVQGGAAPGRRLGVLN
jgi:hypothetical protein